MSKSGATIATSPVSRDAKSTNTAVHWTLFGILTVFSVLFYWSKKKTWPFTSESESKRQNILSKAIARALPAVVYITNYRVVETFKDEDLVFGSGFIVDEKGLILTNAHVIKNYSYISVQLHSGETLSADVIDVDQVADLALISIEGKYKQKFPAVNFCKSNLQLGETVIALGSPLKLRNTITSGIVSAVSRSNKEIGYKIEADLEYIQTDVTITRGNSGSPLVNLDGEVIGINTLTIYPGFGFAIPSQVAEEFLSSARAKNK